MTAAELLENAQKALVDDSISAREREYQYCNSMLRYATAQMSEQPDDSARWSREATEWSKRVQVALKAKADDLLEEIWAAVSAFRRDGDSLADLD